VASANVFEFFEETREEFTDSQIVSPTEQPLGMLDDGCENFHNQTVSKRAEKKPRKM
jgi:hypothetical protein